MNKHNLAYWHPVTGMYYKMDRGVYKFKPQHGHKGWKKSGMTSGFISTFNRDEVLGTAALIEKLREDYAKSMWNRDATLLLKAADMLQNFSKRATDEVTYKL